MSTLLEASRCNIGWQGNYVVCDTESTGFAPNDIHGKLLQVAAIKVDLYHSKEQEGFDTFINPELPYLKPRKSHPDELRRGKIPKKIVELTGITDEMVQNAPPSRDALKDFCDFIGEEAVMVYHNAPHDVMFLHYFGSKVKLDFRSMPVVDTCVLAKHLWPNEPKGGYKLENLAKKLGIEDKNHHNAYNDVEVTLELLKVEIKQLVKRKEVSKVVDFDKLVPYKVSDGSANLRLGKMSCWTGADNSKKRIYITVSKTNGYDTEFANVYFDFIKGEWGQKKSEGDMRIYDFTPIQDASMALLGLFDWNWGMVKTACDSGAFQSFVAKKGGIAA